MNRKSSNQIFPKKTQTISKKYALVLLITVCLGINQLFGIMIGRFMLPAANAKPLRGVFSQLLSWDGSWYYAIASAGYSWVPTLSHSKYQSVAFFPLQAVIDKIAIFLIGQSSAPAAIILVSFSFGIVSILFFERFARKIVGEAATIATILYAFWPASSFYLMGYPTGIISLCIIGALNAHFESRKWTSALWLGIGSAAAPTVIFVVAPLGLYHLFRWLRNGTKAKDLVILVAWGLLSLSGILLYIVYQTIVFHDPFAFVQAQAAWGKTPSFLGHIKNILYPRRYLQQPNAGLQQIAKGYSLVNSRHLQAGAVQLEFGIQRLINFLIFITAFIGLIWAALEFRGQRSAVTWAGWAVFLGYLWFIVATNQNMLDTPRLLFPAIALFLGLGIVVHRFPPLARTLVIMAFAATSCAEIAFAAAGFWVV